MMTFISGESALKTFKIQSLKTFATLTIAALSACGGERTKDKIGLDAVNPEPSFKVADPVQIAELVSVDPGSRSVGDRVYSQLVRLKKDFWIGRNLWISTGVERASVTGLAMSLVGYVPAQITRTPRELIVEQRNQGLFGGSVLGPELILNAYPIVSEDSATILVDFSAPRNAYGLANTLGSPDVEGGELTPRLEILKDIQIKENSLSFHSVLSGQSSKAFYEKGDESAEDLAGLNPFQVSLSLRVDWVLEAATPDFEPLKNTDALFGFFVDQNLVIDSGTQSESFVNRINHKQAMSWELSANTPMEYRQAVMEGVLHWNKAFGSDVLQVRVADGSKTLTDPSTSNVVWDDNKAIGMAFANWRSNPYTGEIVQAQVYMSGSMWAESAKLVYKLRELERKIRNGEPIDPEPVTSVPVLRNEFKRLERELSRLEEKAARATRRVLVGLSPQMAHKAATSRSFCQREAPLQMLRQELSQLRGIIMGSDLGLGLGPKPDNPANPIPNPAPIVKASSPMPPKGQSEGAFMQDVVRAVVLHEVGHTLGLRHNFMASTTASNEGRIQSGSIMDYNDLVIDAQFDRPGDSDIAVIRMGYFDEGSVTRNIAFCTDEDLILDRTPDCFAHDFGSNPVESALVAQESQLILALHNLANGNPQMGIGFVLRAARSVQNLADYIVYPTELGLMRGFLRGDFGFVQKQQKAWENFQLASTMQKMPFPDPLKNAFRQLTYQTLFQGIQPRLSESALESQVLDLLAEALSDLSAINTKATREGALAALLRAQSPGARAKLIAVRDQLVERLELDRAVATELEASKKIPGPVVVPTMMTGGPLVFVNSITTPTTPTERALLARMLDQEFLGRIEKILDGAYFR